MGFGGLSIAFSGLTANQRALDVTAHNIANADNPDYVRQRALQKNSYYDTIGYNYFGKMQMGTGVDPQAVSQTRDMFLDIKYRKEVVKLGYYQGLDKTYESMSSIFSEITSNGIQAATDTFWKSWQAFDSTPTDPSTRGQLQASAIAYAQSMNEVADSLNKLRSDLDKQLKASVGTLNDAVKTIAHMNQLIASAQISNENANDYIDTRNKCIDQLAKDLGVQITAPTSSGMVNVLVNGNAIVNGTDYDQIDIRMYTALDGDKAGLAKLVWHKTGSDFVPDAQSGNLRAILDSRDVIVPDYKNRLNTMVQKTARDINSIHRLGYGIGTGSTTTGLDFFVGTGSDDSDLTIDNIKLNTALKDTNKIATSKSGNIDDHTNAEDIIALRDKNVYLFKEITGTTLAATTIIVADKNKFTICTNNHEYTVQLNPNVYNIPADWATASTGFKASMTSSFKTAKDETGATVDLLTSGIIKLSFDDTKHSVSIALNDKSTKTMSVDDPTGCLSQFGISANAKYDDYYRSTVEALGEGGQEAATFVKSQLTVITQINSKRKEMSGVSKDEEMSNMLVFQHAYDASARVVNAMDEMLDTIINKMAR